MSGTLGAHVSTTTSLRAHVDEASLVGANVDFSPSAHASSTLPIRAPYSTTFDFWHGGESHGASGSTYAQNASECKAVATSLF